mmetsp:Transcript_29213/g.53814  ORF Transcript_29213/g.53814 Transcript_29213/m.53814 type:complete len:89 (+) Transcript_29213:97-363(+)
MHPTCFDESQQASFLQAGLPHVIERLAWRVQKQLLLNFDWLRFLRILAPYESLNESPMWTPCTNSSEHFLTVVVGTRLMCATLVYKFC